MFIQLGQICQTLAHVTVPPAAWESFRQATVFLNFEIYILSC